ncbi:hypothetical protein [Dyadobacter fermentans]|uniref:hypothetical protein n=1 Tax=Dyadobacter fermentans TaxID=94254 RepID=UPI001CBD47D0|nr:hypothetical protein [Dyadobacter fermentans]MBZ1362708.1 hypothetical protein [Dyadobacter fermentans]
MAQVKDTSHPGPWFILFMFGIGVALLIITYGMYKDSLWQDEMSVRSPIVCMKILYGTRGWGTVKNPDVVYASYQGKSYRFELGRKYYRSLLGTDTIEVCLDAASGRAFLPVSGRVKHFKWLYFWLSGIGIAVISGVVWELVRLAKQAYTRT